ncbi:FHA domain-containing protein [Streptomyces sp. NBC_01178]|uniref:FHA domain-containing protein n=1 Tax=Streptomyces sp. NBC_01178 TaxID=2903762 RepID=UPI00386CCE02|nr:FHA domain-containing protein [Streptomyces sp. NBC_01178]
MPTCPNGHQSGSEDWCEVCGHRMTPGGAPAGAVPPPPPPPPVPGYGYPQPDSGTGGGPPTMQAELCPQCRTPREAMAPFCEECRWNFLTNKATSYTPLAPQHGTPDGPPPGLHLPPGFQAQSQGGQGGQHGLGGHGGPGGPGGQPGPGAQGGPGAPQAHDPFDYQGSRPSQMNRPAEPLAPERNGPHGDGTPGGNGGPHGNGGQGGPPPQAFRQGPPPPSFQQQGSAPRQQPAPAPFEPQQQSAPSPFESRQQSAPAPFEPQQRSAPPAPSPFEPQQSSPFAPPQQHSGPPAPPRSSGRPAGEDDWMLPPPSQAQPPQPPQHFQQPGSHQGPDQGVGQDQSPRGPGGQDQGYAGHGRSGQDQGYEQGYDQGGQDQGYDQGGRQHAGEPGRGGPQQSASWTAVIAPDREYFLAMMQRSGPEASGLNLPAYSPEQRLPLTGGQITIGRRRQSTGESPDVDLSVPPEDPGVSHQHAVLVQQPDGGWAVVDQNSTNGTTLNGSEDPIQPYVPVPLQDGDRVHVGAWTTITVRRD